jgi:endonuclease III
MRSRTGTRVSAEKSLHSRAGSPVRKPSTPKKAAGHDLSRREPVDQDVLPVILRRLRRQAAKQDAPIVTLIAVTTREPWRVLSSCILSLRTQDQVTAKAAARMFERWPTIQAMARADVKELEKAIFPVGFYRTKAPQLIEMARRILDEWNGRVPDEIDELLKLKGVGRKTANLVVVAGYEKPGVCVDTHVHRISNIWGYVKTSTPEKTEMALREKLPKRYWMEYNDLLVSFGQTICRPLSPRCSECPIEEFCPRIGVGKRR